MKSQFKRLGKVAVTSAAVIALSSGAWAQDAEQVEQETDFVKNFLNNTKSFAQQMNQRLEKQLNNVQFPGAIQSKIDPALVPAQETLEKAAEQYEQLRQWVTTFKKEDAEHSQVKRNQRKVEVRYKLDKNGQFVLKDGKPVEYNYQTQVNDLTGTGRAPIRGNDRVQNLVDSGYAAITNLVKIDEFTVPAGQTDRFARGDLSQAKLKESPWSDDYWPIYSGILGKRYADWGDTDWPGFKTQKNDWKVLRDFVLAEKNSVKNYVEHRLDYLSPSEKYDILVSGVAGYTRYKELKGFDQPYLLTERMWQDGEYYWTPEKPVETWMGICHGWAPAAYMLDRPTKSIEVLAVDGTAIKFFPSDLKSLGSLLWAKVAPGSRFVGGRCNDKAGETVSVDDENGRVKGQKCFDTNPGTWHASVINQVGVAGRSFVMDATFDYEVWNQPVYEYRYEYFNVTTGDTFQKFKGNEDRLVTKLADWKSDPFQNGEGGFNYRNDNGRSAMAEFVVGVRMKVGYVVETKPTQRTEDSPSRDAISYVTYKYDLELDKSYNITGGEWYSNKHPDFLWTPRPGAEALANNERNGQIGRKFDVKNNKENWSRWLDDDGQLKFPSDLTYPALVAAYNERTPLNAIVKTLIAYSRGEQPREE